MKIFVQAKPNAREEKIEKIVPPASERRQTGEIQLAVAVKEPPVQGLANTAIQKALAGYFQVAPARVRLVSGYSSKQKVFEIL